MKTLYITTTNDELEIKNADNLKDEITFINDLILFGDKVGVNINKLVSYQFIEAKQDTDKNVSVSKEDIVSKICLESFTKVSRVTVFPTFNVKYKYKNIQDSLEIQMPRNITYIDIAEDSNILKYAVEKIAEYLIKENKI